MAIQLALAFVAALEEDILRKPPAVLLAHTAAPEVTHTEADPEPGAVRKAPRLEPDTAEQEAPAGERLPLQRDWDCCSQCVPRWTETIQMPNPPSFGAAAL
jgi:hypothetical protein